MTKMSSATHGARVRYIYGTKAAEAKARDKRIADAAPELLAILKKIVHRATTPLSDGGIDWDDVNAARAIIAKAESLT